MVYMYVKFPKIPEFPENPGISGKSGNFGKCRGNFSGFRGKLVFGISEIVKTSGTFLLNFLFFIKTALQSSVHSIKIQVKVIKIRVFSEKNPPKTSRGVSGKSPEIPQKKVRFFSGFFLHDAKIQPISAKFSRKNFRENRAFLGGKFPRKFPKFRKILKIPENFRKKSVKNDDFGKIRPSFTKRVLKRTF